MPSRGGRRDLLYSGYTLAMMAVFGVEKWCEGEVFSVYFDVRPPCYFAARDGRLWSPPAALRRHPLGDVFSARPRW
ncbi:MAG: hypothetical protein U0R26_02730 [Solirubrobacterales bacterium]